MKRIVVLGGGLSGLAAAWEIADAGVGDVTVVERSGSLGGLAGSFEHAGEYYPLGYHHILSTDHTLKHFLDLIGALNQVQWRTVGMLFWINGRLFDFSRPSDFARLPMTANQKLRFVALMLRAYRTRDWTSWEGRTAADLVDAWGGRGVRETIFEPLCQAKFELPADQVSGAWMGARLHAREGSSKLGYIPGTNWTKTLCDGMERIVRERGVEIRTGVAVTGLSTRGSQVRQVILDDGDTLDADVVVSAIPTKVLAHLLPVSHDVARIQYSALLSLVCGTRQEIRDDFYWLNLLSCSLTASGIFILTSLNPTIGHEGERCVNFVTHLHGADRPLFQLSEEELVIRFLRDFRTVFGVDLALDWAHLSRVPAYSPVFVPEYRNPDIHSGVWSNLYLTGNYRTYPSVASTGTALRAGVETGRVVIKEATRPSTADIGRTSRLWRQRQKLKSVSP